MTSAFLQFAPLTVGPMNSVWPAAHIASKDGKWVELVNAPVCIATLAQDQIGAESARMLAASPDLLTALKFAVKRVKLANSDGDPILSAWVPEAEAAIARAEGRTDD